MNQKMKILKEIGNRADRFNEFAKKLGKHAAEAFGSKHKAQMKNLENIANSALKVSDVLNYIKRQTGKAKKNTQWKKDNFGSDLLDQIETKLKKDRDLISKKLKITSDEIMLDIYLNLIREFIKQLVIHYEYKTGEK